MQVAYKTYRVLLERAVADKEGGFAVIPKDLFHAKAREAIDSSSCDKNDVLLSDVKLKAKKLCNVMKLCSVVKGIDKCVSKKNCALSCLVSSLSPFALIQKCRTNTPKLMPY